MLKITLNDWKKWNAAAKAMAASRTDVFTFQEQVPAAAKADGFKGKELGDLFVSSGGRQSGGAGSSDWVWEEIGFFQ